MTRFQEKVYQTVKRIPKGKVMSYKKVAEKTGFPRAWRAVGNVLNKNHDPQIPCHRVIKSNGEVGGYNKGVFRKITLLRNEEVIKIKNEKGKIKDKNEKMPKFLNICFLSFIFNILF